MVDEAVAVVVEAVVADERGRLLAGVAGAVAAGIRRVVDEAVAVVVEAVVTDERGRLLAGVAGAVAAWIRRVVDEAVEVVVEPVAAGGCADDALDLAAVVRQLAGHGEIGVERGLRRLPLVDGCHEHQARQLPLRAVLPEHRPAGITQHRVRLVGSRRARAECVEGHRERLGVRHDHAGRADAIRAPAHDEREVPVPAVVTHPAGRGAAALPAPDEDDLRAVRRGRRDDHRRREARVTGDLHHGEIRGRRVGAGESGVRAGHQGIGDATQRQITLPDVCRRQHPAVAEVHRGEAIQDADVREARIVGGRADVATSVTGGDQHRGGRPRDEQRSCRERHEPGSDVRAARDTRCSTRTRRAHLRTVPLHPCG